MQGYAIVPDANEEALKEAVYSRGPVAVSIDAAHPSFRFYSHGKLSNRHYTLLKKQINNRQKSVCTCLFSYAP